MSEHKSHTFHPPLYHAKSTGTSARGSAQGPGDESSEQQGWEAYRKWLTHMSRKPAAPRRSTLDHSIYSWKGYHSWADQVRQTWKAEDTPEES